jgi:hypothetical protein
MNEVVAVNCFVPMSAQRAPRVSCPCGGRYTVRIVVEYIKYSDGTVHYAGGRFCYVSDALIDIKIPADSILVRALIYDLHEPDEIVRIEFSHTDGSTEGIRP